ncbi:MAG: hypothetical protein D6B28_00550 [Gammaproteobacteria bacterium]|nr:MAG: hypothetical protein D6B28_00550 [Gammaproteobacteria bacterium]
MNDVYQAPESDVVKQPDLDGSEYGSIEDAISGNYQFEIGAVLSEAWEKTSGVKRVFILALILAMVAQIVLMIVLGGILQGVLELGIAGVIIQQIVLMLVIMPINMGIFMLGIQRSMNTQPNAMSIFNYFDKTIKLFLTMLLVWILVTIGFILLVLPGIYLTVAYMMAMPLVVEKDMGIWEAMETSRKAITKKWFTFLIFFIVASIIMGISAIPLGIGLIWTFPLFMIGLGIIYRNMFGVNAESIQE